eukprot:g5715.t1
MVKVKAGSGNGRGKGKGASVAREKAKGKDKEAMDNNSSSSRDRDRAEREENRSFQAEEASQALADSDVPKDEFWDDFFSEENFQGKTLGEFLNDATPSPATAKQRLAFFDVPHRELFYKEEDLRHFRNDGTVIDFDYDYEADIDSGRGHGPDHTHDAERQAEASGLAPSPSPQAATNDAPEPGPAHPDAAEEDELSSPPPLGSSRSLSSASQGAARLGQSVSSPMKLDDESPDALELPSGGTVESMEMMGGLDLNLNLGAAAFAAASAAYGRSSTSSSSSAGLLAEGLPHSGHRGDISGGGTRTRTANRSSEGSGKSSGARSKVSPATVSSRGSSGRSGGGGGKGIGRNGGVGDGGQAGVRSSVGGRRSRHRQQEEEERMRGKGKRPVGVGRGGGGDGGGAVGAIAAGGAPASKRRRVAGGVLAPTSSSLGKSKSVLAAAPTITDLDINSTRDPMQKKLFQFRQQKATINASIRSSKAAQAVQTTAAAVAGRRGRAGASRGRTSAASSTSTAATAPVPRKVAVVTKTVSAYPSAASQGGAGSTRRDGVLRMGVAPAATKRTASSSKSNSAAPTAAGSGAVVAAKRGWKNVVSKPVTTIKRSMRGNAAAAAGGSERVSKEMSGGVKRKRGPALLSGNVTDRRRPGARKVTSKADKDKDKDDSPALSFDDDLKAKLAEHNRGVTKGRHTYEPSKGRVKDWKKWESQSGKKYYSLNPDEKAEANREILAMLAAERGEKTS